MKNIIILLFLLNLVVLANNDNPDELIKKVKERFSKVKDYEVNAHIKINVDFLKVPETDAKIYFKQPDKVKLSSSQFALIPSEGLNFSPNSFFNSSYSAVFIKNELLWTFNTALVKLVPLDDTQDIVLTTLWIDTDYFIIRKAEVTTKSRGTYVLQLNYDVGKTKFYVPVSMIFMFDVKPDNFPKKFSNNSGNNNNQKKKKSVKGSAEIYYSNYQINKGISDNIFRDEKKK